MQLVKTTIFFGIKLVCSGLSLVGLVAGCDPVDSTLDEKLQVEAAVEGLSFRDDEFNLPDRSISGLTPLAPRLPGDPKEFPKIFPSRTPSMCSDKRWVGYSDSGPCPGSVVICSDGSNVCDLPRGIWELSYVSGEDEPDSAGLKKLCAYDWYPGVDSDPALHLDRLPANGHDRYDSWLKRDCQIMTTFSDDARSPWELGRKFNSQILTQIDALQSYPTKATARRSWVQVSVVDNDPSSSTYDTSNMNWVLGPGVSGHGYSLARMIENVVNPPNQVYKVQIEQEQGLLNSEADTEDKLNGGYTGTPWQLAQAIHRVVERYHLRVRNAYYQNITPPRLVINLSVGWDPRWGGAISTSPDELNANHPGMRAVYNELFHARCYGALIFAAAGNSLNGADTGAAFPARWENLRAPTEAECTAFEGAGDVWGGTFTEFASTPRFSTADPTYNPFLFAISGVTGNDARLMNARPRSVTRLVAPGAFGVGVTYANVREVRPGAGVSVTTTPFSTRIMSGTSVATALATATAAVLWSYSPSKTPAQIADVMHRSGVMLNGPVNVCLSGQTCAAPVRLSVCRALRTLCLEEPWGFSRPCPWQPVSCSTPAAGEGEISKLDQTMFNALVASNNNCQSNSQPSTTCQPRDASDFDSDDTAPASTLPNGYALPRVSPHPIEDWCPTCGINLNPALNNAADPVGAPIDVMFQVSPDFTSTVANPRLTLYDDSGEVVSDLKLPLDAVNIGTSYWITDLDSNEANLSDVTTAVVTVETASVEPSTTAPTSMVMSELVPIMF